jgi:hypothetical protein
MRRTTVTEAADNRDNIDVSDAYQLQQWTEIFDISAAELRAAVDAVGPSARAVKHYVRDQKVTKP